MKRLSFALVGILLAVNAAAGFPLTWWGPGYYSAASSPVQYYNSLNTGEIARWEFEQSGADWRDGWHLTQVGTVPYSSPTAETFGNWAAGPFSTSDYFTLDKTLLQGRSVWSMVIRFTSDNTTAASQYLYAFYDGTNSFRLAKLATTGNLAWYYRNGFSSISTPMSPGEHKVVIRYDGAKANLALDGNVVMSVTDAVTIPSSLTAATIGLYPTTLPWLGTISSLRLYSRALTDYELATPLADNVAYYGLQNSGADWSTQKNHLTTVGNVPYALQSDGTYAAGPFSTSNYFSVPSTIGSASACSLIVSYFYNATPASLFDTFKSSSERINFSISGGVLSALCGSTVNASIGAPDNNFHRLAFTNDGTTTKIFDNGLEIASGASIKLTFTATSSRIGLNTTGTQPNGGYLKNMILFTRDLTPAEIAADYAASFPPALTGSEVATENIDKNTTNAHWRRRR